MSLYRSFSVLLKYQGAAHPRARYNKVCHRETTTYPKFLRSAVISVMHEKDRGCYSEPTSMAGMEHTGGNAPCPLSQPFSTPGLPAHPSATAKMLPAPHSDS